jgi:hypothetical protein
MEWLDRLAEALGEEPLTGQEADRLLRASREVAHRVERTATPLAAFLVGAAVGRRIERGATRETAFDESLDAVLVRLPEPRDPGDGERAPREDG